MNDIWLHHGLDLRMSKSLNSRDFIEIFNFEETFRCLPTGLNKGIIELVPECSTLREIHITLGATGVFKDDVLNNWLVRQNQSEFQYKAVCFCIFLRLRFLKLYYKVKKRLGVGKFS